MTSEGPRYEERTFRAADGALLFGRTWDPDPTTGAVCLVHGIGEHSGRYRGIAEVLGRAGYAVTAFDLRGHGRSSGRRGDARIDRTMEDIDLVLGETRSRFDHVPCFLYGHSLGGVMVLAFAEQRRPALAGTVATGAALQPDLLDHRIKVFFTRALGPIVPGVTVASGLDPSLISRDATVVATYRSDPHVHSKVSLGLAFGLLETIERTFADADRLAVPVLLLHGGLDRLNHPEGSLALGTRIQNDCTVRIYEGLYHEIHNEPERDLVLDDLVGWMDAHAG
jgi:alpha-beta hydrolase superfamily lysophospholipase